MAAVLIDEHVALARIHGDLGQNRPRSCGAKAFVVCQRGAVEVYGGTPPHVDGANMLHSKQSVALVNVYQRWPTQIFC